MATVTGTEPIFTVADVVRSVRFYCDVLGFGGAWSVGEPPVHAGVRWGGVGLMFSREPQPLSRRHEHWFHVDDVQGLHDRHAAAGAPIVSPIENKPWGVREYTVVDPDGYHLRFGGAPTYERPAGATDTLPEYVEVAIGRLSLDDYAAMLDAVGWQRNEPTMAGALEASLFWVVATDVRDGKVVGVARVCGDGRQYTIWDVMVRPEYQSRRIGSAVMETAVAELRRVAPKGAFVGLFTGKRTFYERFGFGDGGGMSLTL